MDITKCKGTNCPFKYNCIRFTKEINTEYQSFFTEIPYKFTNNTCEMLFPMFVCELIKTNQICDHICDNCNLDAVKQFKNTMLNVEVFNEWFKTNKNPLIYAHAGIFLRTDKLSLGHVNDFLIYHYKLTSKVINQINEIKLFSFLDKIRNDWMSKI